jgi:bromodomain-containing factor 1
VSEPQKEPYTPTTENAADSMSEIQTNLNIDASVDDTASIQEMDPVLQKEQFKWFGAMIRNMKKKKDAVLFLNPVDPVALNIPTYFTVITKPMDISTIEKKLASNAYSNVTDAMSDVDLMFENCFTFNGLESAVSIMAKNVQQWYVRESEKLPKSMKEIEMKKKKKPSFVSASSRDSFGDARPKRDLFEGGKRKLASKKGIAEMKFCSHIYREVNRKQYAHFVWPFLNPVDPEALGIPHYREQIKEPMDLSTIRKKMDFGEYSTVEEYESDFRLMLQNCFTFNAIGTEVYNLGKQLETLFNTKMAEKTSFLMKHGEALSRRGEGSSDDDGDGN